MMVYPFSLSKIIIWSFCLFSICLLPFGLENDGTPYFSSMRVQADSNQISPISGLTMTIPDAVYQGTFLRIIDIIRNNDSHSSDPFRIEYVLVNASGLDERYSLGTLEIQRLVQGGQKKINMTFPVPPNVPAGNYKVHRIMYTTGVGLADGIPMDGDEKIVQIRSSDEQVLTGYTDEMRQHNEQSLFIRSFVQNNQKEIPIETKIFYYLSKSGSISDNPIPLGITEEFILSPREQRYVNTTFTLPEGISAGDYFLVSSFLPIESLSPQSDQYFVTDEPIALFTPTSQSVSYPINAQEDTTNEPDIMTVRTEYPDIMYIGESVKIKDSITNIGGSTAGIVRVEYLLSSDDAGSDLRHLDWWTIHNLKAGETRTSEETIGIPEKIRPGTYYLTKKISVTSSPPEKNTANNAWTGNKPVRVEYNPTAKIPDLTHVLTKFPCGNPGDFVEITDTITNIGNACAHDIRVVYYISPYESFDPATARYLGIWEISTLCVGEQRTNTISVQIPPDISGIYYWYSVIDPCTFMPYCDNEIPELDKSNNIQIGQITSGPCILCGC